VPGDPEKPTVTSGIRLGTAAGCSRGFGVPEFREIGGLIGAVLAALARDPAGDAEVEGTVRERVRALCAAHPIYTG
jgi:glycine hydroxymethyltransferase